MGSRWTPGAEKERWEEQRPPGRLGLAGVQAGVRPAELSVELGGDSSTRAVIPSSYGRVKRTARHVAEARQRRLPRVRRRRYPLESMPVIAPGRAARVLFGQAPGSSRATSAGRGAAAPGRRCGAGSRWTRTSSTRRSIARRSRAAIRAAARRAAATARRRRRSSGCASYGATTELRLLRPQLIVTVGGLAARRLLGVEERDASASACATSWTARSRSRSLTRPARAAG